MEPDGLANTAWAFATVVQSDTALFGELEGVAEKCRSDFKPQNIANTAWAFATIG